MKVTNTSLIITPEHENNEQLNANSPLSLLMKRLKQ